MLDASLSLTPENKTIAALLNTHVEEVEDVDQAIEVW
jgi:hypothetical protein